MWENLGLTLDARHGAVTGIEMEFLGQSESDTRIFISAVGLRLAGEWTVRNTNRGVSSSNIVPHRFGGQQDTWDVPADRLTGANLVDAGFAVALRIRVDSSVYRWAGFDCVDVRFGFSLLVVSCNTFDVQHTPAINQYFLKSEYGLCLAYCRA